MIVLVLLIAELLVEERLVLYHFNIKCQTTVENPHYSPLFEPPCDTIESYGDV